MASPSKKHLGHWLPSFGEPAVARAGGEAPEDRFTPVEHPPKTDRPRRARSESERVVRIAGHVRLAAFVAAPRPREFQQRFAAESERQAPADAVLHVVEVELTVGQAPC